MIFLRKPAEIREAVCSLFRGGQLDVAVAFVGADWESILSGYEGKLRVLCWLSSTNTNPYAVDSLRKRCNTIVRQRDTMHCKVYLAPHVGAVVGSANLSRAALEEGDTAGQDEAAVFISQPSVLRDIEKWFKAIWNEKTWTRRIRRSDIRAAKAAFDKARAARQKAGVGMNIRKGRQPIVPSVPRKIPATILEYLDAIRSTDLRRELADYVEAVGAIRPHNMTLAEHESLIRLLISWTGHPASYETFRAVPLSKVRKGFGLLFDDTINVESRLDTVINNNYLLGLRVPTLSLLLYWRFPELYPPYNHRTDQFLKDFGLKSRGMSASSPRTYATWIRWSIRFHQKLELPTVGHVDRLVERYFEDYYEE